MKKHTRILAAVITVITMFTLFAGSAYATSGADTAPVVTASPTDAAVSGADVTSPATPATSLLVPFGTTKYNFKDHGIKIELPNFEKVITPSTREDDAYGMLGVSTSGMFASGYLFYDCDATMSEYVIYCAYEVTDYSKMIRSYSSADEDLRAGILAQAQTTSANFGLGESTAFGYETINGQDYIHYGFIDSGVTSDIYETIFNGVKYTFFMRMPALTTEEDIAAKQAIVDSIKLYTGRLGYAYQGVSGFGFAALIIIAVLVVICLLLAFFLIRFSVFQSSANSSFNIIGFDFPSSANGEYDEDVNELDDFDYDNDDDDDNESEDD